MVIRPIIHHSKVLPPPHTIRNFAPGFGKLRPAHFMRMLICDQWLQLCFEDGDDVQCLVEAWQGFEATPSRKMCSGTPRTKTHAHTHTYYIHIIYILYTYYIHIIYTFYTYYIHIIYILYTYYIHIIYILYTYYIHR